MIRCYNGKMKKSLLWILVFGWGALILYLTSIPSLKVSDVELISFIISSLEHFFFFGVQAILLFFAIRESFPKLNSGVAAVVLTSLYGLLDELHQLSVFERTADPIDWILDTIGALIFIVIIKKVINLTKRDDHYAK